MKTLSFYKQFTIGRGEGDFTYSDSFYDQFIISNLDVRIKEITPFFSYNISDFDIGESRLEVSSNGIFSIGSIETGRLLDSPVKYTPGISSTHEMYLPINQRNVVNLRVFAGDFLSALLNFHITGKGAVNNVFQIQMIAGVNILYEEEVLETFR